MVALSLVIAEIVNVVDSFLPVKSFPSTTKSSKVALGHVPHTTLYIWLYANVATKHT